MIKAIIFDFFGVLVGDGFDFTYRQAGGDPEKDKAFIEDLLERANRAKISHDDFRQEVCQKLGITHEQYQQAISKAELPNTELLNFIKRLRPNYKTAVLSNANKGSLERRISREELMKYFDVIVESGSVGYIKPELQIYELTAAKLGVKAEECVFIDDRIGYVQAASELGMKSIWYRDFGQMKAQLAIYLTAGPNN